MKQTLPLGTVFKIKDNELQFMIIGYKNHKNIKDNYDYLAVVHPVGIGYLKIRNKDIFLIKKNEIEEIYSIGYVDKDVFCRIKSNDLLNSINKKGE